MVEESKKPKKRGGRSPGYPSINLQEAIEKAKIFKEKEGGGKFSTPYQSIISHWGYSPKGSHGLLMLSSLIKYGLIRTMGTGEGRKGTLSDLALKMLFLKENGEETSIDYKESIREAALNPPIFKELWEKFNGEASDITMQRYLIFEREPSFDEDAASKCIKHFNNTISFANLTKSDNISRHSGDKKTQIKEKKMDSMPANINKQDYSSDFGKLYDDKKQIIKFPVTISGKMTADLRIECPIGDKELYEFLSALEALKPGLLQKVLNKENVTEEQIN